MALIPSKTCGIDAAKEVAYAKRKPVRNSSYGRRTERINKAREQIYATVFCSFARQDDSLCRAGSQQ